MASVTPPLGPAALAAQLERLMVRVESAHVEHQAVALPDYPGGPRPSSVVRLSGRGCFGLGENVAFSRRDHDRFAGYVARWFRSHRATKYLRVGCAVGVEGTPYERAALEAALIDLGLRQARLSLYDLTRVREAALRVVMSLAAAPAPQAVIQRLRERGYRGGLKVDVDPSWSEHVVEELAQDSQVVIFDFKGRATAPLARNLYAALPAVLLEDPPDDFHEPGRGSEPSRVSRDASIIDEAAVVRAHARGEIVNLKAPRMGGPLAVLRGLELALAPHPPFESRPPRIHTYLGGMFEVGVGRLQARQLAALYSASAPNDLALNVALTKGPASYQTSSPTIVRFDEWGFGSSLLESPRALQVDDDVARGACAADEDVAGCGGIERLGAVDHRS
jgi:L-alanine-DL-glutamate epimerase-like enolase superfamily enzyme